MIQLRHWSCTAALRAISGLGGRWPRLSGRVDKSCASSAVVFWCGSFAMRDLPMVTHHIPKVLARGVLGEAPKETTPALGDTEAALVGSDMGRGGRPDSQNPQARKPFPHFPFAFSPPHLDFGGKVVQAQFCRTACNDIE